MEEDLNTVVIGGEVINEDFAAPLPQSEDEFNFMIRNEREGRELELRIRVSNSWLALAKKCREKAVVGAKVIVVGGLCTDDFSEFPYIDAIGVTVSDQ